MSNARCSSHTSGIGYTVSRHGSHKPILPTCQTPGAVVTALNWNWLNCKPTWFTKTYSVNMSDARCSSHGTQLDLAKLCSSSDTTGIGYTVSCHGSQKAILSSSQMPGAGERRSTGIGCTVSRHGSQKAILSTCQTPGAVVTALNWNWLLCNPTWFT
ncbi:hypothetical protein J6590_053576 [Homalodisca vitripennis]|nr:hypothetical protein J6590_053576 [Homalodisca vitripennis]